MSMPRVALIHGLHHFTRSTTAVAVNVAVDPPLLSQTSDPDGLCDLLPGVVLDAFESAKVGGRDG
jgi:hypothetical protein